MTIFALQIANNHDCDCDCDCNNGSNQAGDDRYREITIISNQIRALFFTCQHFPTPYTLAFSLDITRKTAKSI
jgi:hypothetical protein